MSENLTCYKGGIDAMVEQVREIVAENSGCSSFRCFHDDECACRDVSRQILALAHADDGWQPIESAPKDGTEILTVGIDNKRVIATKWLAPGPYVRTPNGSYNKNDGWYWSGWDGAVGPVRPTHWRPLPAPPKDGGK